MYDGDHPFAYELLSLEPSQTTPREQQATDERKTKRERHFLASVRLGDKPRALHMPESASLSMALRKSPEDADDGRGPLDSVTDFGPFKSV